jgi:hypothetical protein
LSVSLLAVAAIAASLFLGRYREAPTTRVVDSNTTSAARQLDAMRAAGL